MQNKVKEAILCEGECVSVCAFFTEEHRINCYVQ